MKAGLFGGIKAESLYPITNPRQNTNPQSQHLGGGRQQRPLRKPGVHCFLKQIVDFLNDWANVEPRSALCFHPFRGLFRSPHT